MKNLFLISNLNLKNQLNSIPNYTHLEDYLSNWEINLKNNDQTKIVYNYENKISKNIVINEKLFPRPTDNIKYHEKIRNWKVWCLDNDQQNKYTAIFNPIQFIGKSYLSTLEELWNNNDTFIIQKKNIIEEMMIYENNNTISKHTFNIITENNKFLKKYNFPILDLDELSKHLNISIQNISYNVNDLINKEEVKVWLNV